MFPRIHPFCLLIVAILAVGAFANEPEMIIGLDRTSIYEGETFLYQILVSDSVPIDDDLVPDLSAFTDFQVKTLPKQVQTSGGTSIRQVINGQVVRDETTPVTHIVKFSYILTPNKIGKLTIPAPRVVVAGKPLAPATVQVQRQAVRNATGAIPVTVQAPEQQDLAQLEIETDRTRLYPFQPLTVTAVVRIKELSGSFAGKNPLNLLKEPPQLMIPWAESDDALPKGMVPRQKAVDWLNSMLVRRAGRGAQGFAINDHADERLSMGFDDGWFNDPFSTRKMFQKVPYQFAPSPKQVQRKDAEDREATYWEYRFSRTFQPEELGEYTFGPVMLKGALAESTPETRDGAIARSVYAIAPAMTVTVADVPRENRPDSYIGAFGTFDWSVDLQPRKAKVGEPMTLTLRLIGQGSTAGVQLPDLAAIPEVASRFRTYPPTENVDESGCTFTCTIRPTQAGDVEFPSIPVSWFDVEKEEFTTVRSTPIPIEIEETGTLTPGPIYGGAPHRAVGDLELSEKGIFTNMTGPAGAVDQSVDYRFWAGGLLSLAGVYFVLALAVTVRQRIGSDPRHQRRRTAPAKARQRLGTVSAQIKESGGMSSEAVELGAALQSVFFGYVADLTDGIAEGMTTRDACRKLLELGAREQTVAEVRGLLETLDGARYGGLDIRSLDDLAGLADRLLKELASKY